MKALWLFAIVIVALTPAHAGEKEKELCADVNGLRICEVPARPGSLITLLPGLTDPPDHTFFSAEI